VRPPLRAWIVRLSYATGKRALFRRPGVTKI
jgi:hypothetical protein